MIGLRSRDGAFFSVICTDGIVVIDQKDVVSLTVVEEMDKACTGTLKLHDPNFTYARSLRNFRHLLISWGYVQSGIPTSIGEITDIISGGMQRRGLNVIIQSPSGSAENGTHYYNCNFIDIDTMNLQQQKVYEAGTKGTVITEAMFRLGVLFPEVQFAGMTQTLGGGVSVRQTESDFRFLVRMAREWRCFFRVGRSPVGLLVGCFIDPYLLSTSQTVKALTANLSGLVVLNYNAGTQSNVISYTWQCHEGEGGVGDGVMLQWVNGEAVPIRYTIEQETVKTWRLNEGRVQAAIQNGSLVDAANVVGEIVSAADFASVKKYFDAVDQTTAPNGYGYTINCHCLGVPFCAPPTLIQFGYGFPDRLRYPSDLPGVVIANPTSMQAIVGAIPSPIPSPNVFYLRQVTHTITKAGYFTDLEVVDVYTLSPTGMML